MPAFAVWSREIVCRLRLLCNGAEEGDAGTPSPLSRGRAAAVAVPGRRSTTAQYLQPRQDLREATASVHSTLLMFTDCRAWPYRFITNPVGRKRAMAGNRKQYFRPVPIPVTKRK